MDQPSRVIADLVARQDAATPLPKSDNAGQELLNLLQDPFNGQLQVGSIWASMATSFGITAGIAILFCLVRPYNTIVYAPKLKHADELHSPPPLGKGIFAWISPLWKTNEQDLVRLVGMDATIFMRFTKMCRNIFLVLAILGCVILIPAHWVKTVHYGDVSWLDQLTPKMVWGDAYWAQSVFAWVCNLVVCFFLWWNYRKVLQLRRAYFESPEYQASLHARTLMLYDIPKKMGSDEGIARLIDQVAPKSSFSRTAIARNVKILPQLISQHEATVRKLEKVLARYLKDPHNLPDARPLCKPSKKDRSYTTYSKGQKVDAIEYLTQRIKDLEVEIKEIRAGVDKRSSMSYGFASYSDISEAHSIGFMARNKKPQGATIKLAPRPNDVIWDNMPLSAATRGRRKFINNLWVALLTVVWIAPNAMIAIFLVNLSNLGLFFPAFQRSLETSEGFWKVVQGVGSPALTSGIYLLLPIIFRRLSMQGGDQTKSGRERHVTAKLYAFFVFNNLIVFSLFSAIWSFVASVKTKTDKGVDGWKAILESQPGDILFIALCKISPFWINWLLQRQLGTAVDLAQLWPLMWGFIMRKSTSPTPRELIELTAPPPFDYASYYNYFLYYSTAALCYAGIQPLVLPAVAIYFTIDVMLRKYLIMYVFVTKTESGGMFWRVLFNRFIFALILSNIVAFVIIFVRGNADHIQAYVVAPLPFLVIGFKIFCAKKFDHKIHYFSTNSFETHHEADVGIAGREDLRSDRLAARFGHPALYRPLTTPMVHAKAQNILASVYSGRLTAGREAGSGDSTSVSGYSDMYALDPMKAGRPGKLKNSGASMPGFEVVPESKLDFEFYKNRQEFAEDHGGGEIYGTQGDIVRAGTPSSMFGPDSRPGTPGGMGGRVPFAPPMNPEMGTSYAAGYHLPGRASPPVFGYPGQPTFSQPSSPRYEDAPQQRRSPVYRAGHNESSSNLVGNAAAMPSSPHHDDTGFSSGGRTGYGNLPQIEPEQDPMSYDYFRGSRRTPGAGSGR